MSIAKLLGAVFHAALFISACDDSLDPVPSKYSGETTINTLIREGEYSGFSFASRGIVSFPNPYNIIPDIIVLVQSDSDGNISGVFFSSPEPGKAGFNFIKQTEDPDSAQTVFDNLSEVPGSNYLDLAIPVMKYQIWAIKTVDDKYGKILVVHTDAYLDNSDPSAPNYYGEARFKWIYQTDGSRSF
ncbi:MAG: hypothetical protein JW995_04340 [Melioribacteraceae bacterium]|nr:hypothetical protein [Melioribacteraceae bacterium]